MSWLCDALCQRIIQSDAFLTVWSLLLLLCCHHFLFLCSLSLSLPAAIVFCHSFRFTIGSSSLSHSLFAFLCLSECKEGIRQWPQYSRCTPAVPAGTAEMAVLMLWPAAPGYTWREEITGGWSAQAKESADLDPVCAFGLWPWVLNLRGCPRCTFMLLIYVGFSRVYREWSEKENIFRKRQFSRCKCSHRLTKIG